MIPAVFDSNLLISAFFSRHQPGAVSMELLRLMHDGAVALYLSPAIIEETAGVPARSKKEQAQYRYTPESGMRYCADLETLGTVIANPAPLPDPVSRDPDDDKIIACAVAATAEYLVTRDRDLLALGSYGAITMIAPEAFLQKVRSG